MAPRKVSLDDKYDLAARRVYLSGTQAVVRLLLTQRERDRRAGLDTAGYISGYRGSPLGGLDQQLWRAEKALSSNNILFQPGLNEDLAATALWGAQQAEMRGEGRHDGVFGIWYGKGPGVDRSGDALRHANLAGTSRHGGVIALMGDDHTCESSTTAHQSELAFVDAMIPILNPAGVQEILDYGLLGWALSRFSGLWVGLKCLKDNVESTASVDGSLDRVSVALPDFAMPPNGLNIRPGVHPLEQELRLHEHKLPAALAFVRENRLDRIVMQGGRRPRLGVASVGKSWLDTLQALDLLGIDERRAADLGIRLYKVAVPWPLEPQGVAEFADGLKTVLVVEEKRALVESQMKELLYGRAGAPAIVGKRDEAGRTLFPSTGALDAQEVAVAIGRQVLATAKDAEVAARLAHLERAQAALAETEDVAVRTPYFCSGCPHNSSTHVPEASRAYAGIGCHYMVQWMDRATEGYTHMGAEGANWIGEAPFSKRDHVFVNLGDGTYNHSGALAIRAAAAAGINITYKILYNDAVAMTGGQPNDGGLSVDAVARQVAAEGARRIALVADDPGRYGSGLAWPAGLTFHHRSELDRVQRELREVEGLTILIYDQTCAAELRRRRKRGLAPDLDRRVLINALVCEGCGDCSVQSNCVSVQPLETELGRKRAIDQSNCNKDYSCLAGFCPSFVSVHGARLRRAAAVEAESLPAIPEPEAPALDRPFGLLVTGVGGTGVVTVGQVLGMAAHIEGKGVGLIDMAGLAQKGGAVTTHMRLAPRPEDIRAIRLAAEDADSVLACDMVVAGSKKALAAVRPGESLVFVNTHEAYPGDFTRDPDFTLPARRLKRAIEERAGTGRARFVDAHELAARLLGDSIAANMFMAGFAWQQGGLPLGRAAIREAIRLNGVAVDMNLAAFEWGRRAAHDPAAVAAAAGIGDEPQPAADLDTLVERRAAFLTDYQDAAYAERYRSLVARVAEAEQKVTANDSRLAEAAARSLFKLMAVKDEYEVARLFTDGAFERQMRETFESWERVEFHLAPPLVARRDPATGRPRKRAFGPWMMRGFRMLARLRRLRGTALDIFGYLPERKWERRLLTDYEALLDEIAGRLSAGNHEAAVALAGYPEKIRGFGPVKQAQAAAALAERDRLLAAFRAPHGGPGLAEAAE